MAETRPSFDQELWERLRAFRVDPPGTEQPFLVRFAREHPNIGLEGARALWREYLRFLYLALRAGHPVTPSGAVDELWHLHLVYTRSYWQDLCPRVLERELHHGPTLGGADEGRRYREQYVATLASYRLIFGEPPPARFWPSPARRFAEAPVRIDARRHYVLRRPTWLALGALSLVAGTILWSVLT